MREREVIHHISYELTFINPKFISEALTLNMTVFGTTSFKEVILNEEIKAKL